MTWVIGRQAAPEHKLLATLAACRLTFQRAGGLENVLRVAGYTHVAPTARDFSIPIDEECGAFNAHVLTSVHRLLDPHPIRRGRATGFVRQQKNAEASFSRNLRWLAELSGEIPRTSVPTFSKSAAMHVKSLASDVHPGVSSLG